MGNSAERIVEALQKHQAELLSEWIKEQMAAPTLRPDLFSESKLREQSAEFVRLFSNALQAGNLNGIETPEWDRLRDFLGRISRSRAEQGFSPSETATFIFSFKQPLFSQLRQEYGQNLQALAEDIWTITALLDKLGLYTTEVYQKSRDEVILRQQQELLELSTPVVKLWEGILAVPLIGTLDSARTQTVMESLLQEIVETGSDIAIIDITGVPVVDTLVAQHLLKTVAAARLMGAECIISGIRPAIAQSMVGLGLQFDVTTKANLAGAFAVALQRRGFAVTPLGGKG